MPGESDLLGDVLAGLRDRKGASTLDRVTVGARHLLVEVEADGERFGGPAHRPPGTADVPARGTDAFDLARWAVDPPATAGDESLVRGIGIATLNALSAPHVDWRPGDPMAALDPDVGVVATVGLFRPAFGKFDAVEVRVVEREPVEVDAPAGVEVSTFTPDVARTAFEGADVLFLTGSSLIYGGAGRYVRLARESGVPTVVLIGATASFLPGPAFDAGVTVLAGARVADADAVRSGIERGDCGTDLHEAGLEKVYVVADDAPGIVLGSGVSE